MQIKPLPRLGTEATLAFDRLESASTKVDSLWCFNSRALHDRNRNNEWKELGFFFAINIRHIPF